MLRLPLTVQMLLPRGFTPTAAMQPTPLALSEFAFRGCATTGVGASAKPIICTHHSSVPELFVSGLRPTPASCSGPAAFCAARACSHKGTVDPPGVVGARLSRLRHCRRGRMAAGHCTRPPLLGARVLLSQGSALRQRCWLPDWRCRSSSITGGRPRWPFGHRLRRLYAQTTPRCQVVWRCRTPVLRS